MVNLGACPKCDRQKVFWHSYGQMDNCRIGIMDFPIYQTNQFNEEDVDDQFGQLSPHAHPGTSSKRDVVAGVVGAEEL